MEKVFSSFIVLLFLIHRSPRTPPPVPSTLTSEDLLFVERPPSSSVSHLYDPPRDHLLTSTLCEILLSPACPLFLSLHFVRGNSGPKGALSRDWQRLLFLYDFVTSRCKSPPCGKLSWLFLGCRPLSFRTRRLCSFSQVPFSEDALTPPGCRGAILISCCHVNFRVQLTSPLFPSGGSFSFLEEMFFSCWKISFSTTHFFFPGQEPPENMSSSLPSWNTTLKVTGYSCISFQSHLFFV